MGRFSDGGNYPKDIVKGALSKVFTQTLPYQLFIKKKNTGSSFFWGIGSLS